MKINLRSLMIMIFVLPHIVSAHDLKPDVEHAIANGAMTQIILNIRDDMGEAVSNASIRVVMDMPSEEYCIYGKSDSNGVFVISGKTNGNRISILAGKDGYYGAKVEITYLKMGNEYDVKDGKWQPFGKSEIVELRKIKNPQKMVKNLAYLGIPATNVWIGFDMETISYTKPFGNGKISDLEIKVEWDGLPPWKSEFCRAEFRVAEPVSGGYYVPNINMSDFMYPYVAKPEALFNTKSVYIINRNGNFYTTNVPFPTGTSLVLRTRCKTDESGKILSANYSRIEKFNISPGKRGAATLTLFYTFNTTPNDTNLEDIETAEASRNFIRQCEPPLAEKGQ